jgi:hypothetical protein
MKPFVTLFLLLFCLALPVAATDTYRQDEILAAIDGFFGQGAENLGQVVQKIFQDYGEPNAYITGEEFAATLGVGVRYGTGTLNIKQGDGGVIYWQGPSIGFDVGANLSKVFVLIYQLPETDALFQRFPGIEGSLYFVGGVGVNYLQAGDVVVAPIRFGAGWRQGLSAGYMNFTRNARYNPF